MTVVFRLPSILTVSEVAQCRADLAEALSRGPVALDAGTVESIDGAGLQLVEAAFRTAARDGLTLSFVPGGRGAVEAPAAALGLTLSADPSRWRDPPASEGGPRGQHRL